MTKIIFLIMGSLILVFSLSSCTLPVMQQEPDEPTTNQEATESRITELVNNLTLLEHKYEELQKAHADLQIDYQHLQTSHEKLRDSLDESTLRDPTWAELKVFIEQDDTNTMPYSEGSFDCEGFAITLRDRAWRYGFRCAFVALNFAGTRGHALNAFQTTDNGIIFVDVTEHDKIAYVRTGQPYGTIAIDAVKSDYIDCYGEPDKFWDTLTWKSHSAPFSYDYYANYRQRLEFFNQSVNAFNQAASEYNNGSTKWSSAQLNKLLENIEALEKDLGSPIYEPISIVQTMEVYWN